MPNHAASEPGGASRLQSWRPVRRVAELGALGRNPTPVAVLSKQT